MLGSCWEMGLSQRDGTVCGEALRDGISDSASSPLLSEHSAPAASGATRQSELQQSYPHIPNCQGSPRWWLHKVSMWNGKSLQASPPQLEIETNASLTGWGAYCQGNLIGGRWSEEELAALFALKTYLKHAWYVSVLLISDNVTTVANINHLGGTRSCVLESLFDIDHQSDVGFASLCNKSLSSVAKGFSWHPDLEAEATDAFSQDWRNLRTYTHPPWCLIDRAQAKALCQRATLVLVTPCWPTQSWFPQLMEMLADFPLALPDPLESQQITPSPNCDCPVCTISSQLVA